MKTDRLPRRQAISAAMLVILAGLLTGCPQIGGPVGGLGVGQEAPEITAEGWLNGEPPEDLHGKVAVVEAWAYW